MTNWSETVGTTPRGRPLGQAQGPAPTFEEEINDLRLRGLYRKLRTLTDYQGTRVKSEGKEIVLFCGNDYLGLSRHPEVVRAAQEAVKRYGVGAGASRLISGTSDIHTQLEQKIAHFKRKEAALVFGSGYLANVGVLSALAREGDLIVMDKLSHASLIDGARLSQAEFRVFPHKNYEKCEEIIVGARSPRPYRRILLVSDSVFSMDGDSADLPQLIAIKEKYNCLLLIDDAHGLGVCGPEGRGATEGLEEKIDLIVGTLSKALGVLGGFVAGSGILIEHLINFSRPFIFATAPPAAFLAAAGEALQIIQNSSSLRQKLWKNVDEVQNFLKEKGFVFENRSPIIPLIIGDEKKTAQISELLLEKGILIPAIRYPSVAKGKARLRLTLSALHNGEDLEKLSQALKIFSR